MNLKMKMKVMIKMMFVIVNESNDDYNKLYINDDNDDNLNNISKIFISTIMKLKKSI